MRWLHYKTRGCSGQTSALTQFDPVWHSYTAETRSEFPSSALTRAADHKQQRRPPGQQAQGIEGERTSWRAKGAEAKANALLSSRPPVSCLSPPPLVPSGTSSPAPVRLCLYSVSPPSLAVSSGFVTPSVVPVSHHRSPKLSN